jgi:hypothetical protein
MHKKWTVPATLLSITGMPSALSLMVVLATMLIPALVYAGNPTANFTINVVPAGSCCGALTPPPLAQAAGFTTLAANYDFSQPQYSGSSSTWLDCGGGNDTSKVWHQDNQDFNDGYPPCNLIAQVNDGGATVLQFTMPTGDAATSPHTQSMITRTRNGTSTALYPIVGYFETVWRRQDDADFGGVLFHDSWSSCTNSTACPGGNITLEEDWVEVASTFGDAGYHNWGRAGGCGSGEDCAFAFYGSNPIDVTQYTTWAGLITSDGNTFWFCTIVNGNYVGSCVTSTLTASQSSGAASQNYLMLGVYTNTGARTALGRMNVKSLRVWTCANWQVQGACHGPLVHN